MRVAQVPRRFVREEWGGTETVVLETSKRLLAMGHDTFIACPNALASTNEEDIDGVQVHRYPYFYPYLGLRAEARRQLDKKGGNLFSFQLMRALKEWPGLDVIHLHTQKRLGGIGRHVALKRGIPYVVSLHGGVYDVPRGEAATWTEPSRGALEWGRALGMWVGSNRVMEDASAILCVGAGEQKAVQERYPHKNVLLLPNGVNSERFATGDGAGFRARRGIPAEATVILTVGRIDVQKNQMLLLRLLPELRRMDPRAHLVLIGHVTNASYRQEIEAYAQRQGLTGHLTLIPGLDTASHELVNAYHAADLFALPSVHEPFGIVVLEAWAAGLPVVASRVGGIPSFVVEGADGLLFDPDDEAQVVAAFFRALTDQPLRAAMAARGKARAAAEYGWDVVTRKLVGIYEDAIAQRPQRGA